MTTIFRPDVLAGKTVVITGGGTGMGAHMAAGMAAVGAQVAPVSRNMAHVGEVATAITDAGGTAAPFVCDVRDADAVAAMVDAVCDRFGRIDIVVNSAAGNFRCPTIDLSPNAWRTVIDIDLNGTFLVSTAAARKMIPAGGGVILNITGNNVHTHGDRMAHAGAAKAGIDHLTRSLAKEWGPHNIRVNSIAPGPINTAGAAQALGSEEALRQQVRTSPLAMVGECSDITDAAIFLVSSAARFITGAALMVDGGHSWAGYDLPG